jgi:hypothetical protein
MSAGVEYKPPWNCGLRIADCGLIGSPPSLPSSLSHCAPAAASAAAWLWLDKSLWHDQLRLVGATLVNVRENPQSNLPFWFDWLLLGLTERASLLVLRCFQWISASKPTAGSSAGSAPVCCSETAVTPLHMLKPKHLRIFEPLHSPLHSVTFRYIFGCVITAAPGAILPLTPSRAAVWSVLGISVRTLHDWEQGSRTPSGAAQVLLRVAAPHPQAVLEAAA